MNAGRAAAPLRQPEQKDPRRHDHVDRINAVLARLLPSPSGTATPSEASAAELASAMRYAVLGGGKRLRARMVYAAGRAGGACRSVLDHAAAAVEFIHAFSLVHDDLPALDNDDLRRGRPALHVQYGEATAILAGDALLALAFETASDATLPPPLAARWVRLLAQATGSLGMIGGQMADLAGEACELPLAEVEALHRRKAGALIHAAAMAGAVAGDLPTEHQSAIGRFGQEIGLAFQIQDDVLDATAPTDVLGKPQGADAQRGKSTYVSALGIEAAAAEAARRLALAIAHLQPLGSKGQALIALGEEMVQRRS